MSKFQFRLIKTLSHKIDKHFLNVYALKYSLISSFESLLEDKLAKSKFISNNLEIIIKISEDKDFPVIEYKPYKKIRFVYPGYNVKPKQLSPYTVFINDTNKLDTIKIKHCLTPNFVYRIDSAILHAIVERCSFLKIVL